MMPGIDVEKIRKRNIRRSTPADIREEIRARSEAVITEISADIGAMWKTLNPREPIENSRRWADRTWLRG
jgi:hypothetical protein